MSATFKHVMLMVNDVTASVEFYSKGLGLPVTKNSPAWAELDAGGTTIALHAAEGASGGNSPILSFQVEDVYESVQTLESLGASLEGRIREPSFGKVAAMRSPDGHLVSLLQPTPKTEEAT
ncbi:Glyoxalase/bleomycin resistance protein/dioxygenase [Halothece sp. PCC 7418]|uniref:VOC family protein n=1 Tax=Halothece sp. (strain PCC 7418) TaxID=65093 RepID=UPI0002A07771|nr:VOC family protein [Halothece sp. PCC 7418]AFZ44833.1 Glyoxalase/bleomycin resistance protein/dioxygenase [Halothece sp. PCC 7418]